MRSQLTDPSGARARPGRDYTFGCKRILFSSDFLPALQRPNVELVTEPIAARRARRAAHRRRARCTSSTASIWATGFKTNDFMFPMEITGVGGESLHDALGRGPARAPRHHACRASPTCS